MMIRLIVSHTRLRTLQGLTVAEAWRRSSRSSSSSSSPSPPTAEPNKLDQSILKLSTDGASHLPRLLKDMIDSEVYFITQNSAEISVHDALTFPSSSDTMYPSFFSSKWAIERYLDQHDLKQVLGEATIQPIIAREFLQQTRPAPVLFNPPVFTLTPELIDQILQDRYDVVPSEDSSDVTPTQRLENQLDSNQLTKATELPPPEVLEEVSSFLEHQSTIVAAYLVQVQSDDNNDATRKRMALCCLCSMTDVEAFGDVEQDLRKVLTRAGHDEYETLCLNTMGMDTFEFVMNECTPPIYLHLGNMSDVEFDLFLDKLSVGPTGRPPSHQERQDLLQQWKKEDLPVQAAYQLVYQVSGFPTQGRIGTFLDAGSDASLTPKRSLRQCLLDGWGYLHELPPEMASYCRNSLEPIFVKGK